MTGQGPNQSFPEPNVEPVEKDASQDANSKGKNKATASGASSLARLQSSSNMLSRAVLSSSAMNGASDLSAGANVAAKATGSGSSRSSHGEPAHVAYRGINGRLEAPDRTSGFRSTRYPSHGSEDYEQFIEGRDPDPGFATRQLGDVGTVETNLIGTKDGSAVLELLSTPDELDKVYSITEDDYSGDTRVAETLHNALFKGPSSRNVPWDHLLNFNPSFVGTPKGDRIEAHNQLGTGDIDEARRMWVNQWRDVLSSYTDEVWGALEPLVEAARQEVEASDVVGIDTVGAKGALGRLRMILAHVRGS